MKKKKLRRVFYIIIFLVIIYFYGAGDYGFFQFFSLNAQKKSLEKEIVELEKEHKKLIKEREMLEKMDLRYLEKVAREKYGMVKKGEKVFRIVLKR